MSNRELIENALKRVNALTKCDGRLYHDNRGWYIVWAGDCPRFDESVVSAGELLAYLHGIEDALKFMKGN